MANQPSLLLKRIIDLTLSSIMIFLSIPVYISIALAIKFEDRGPIFYCQQRWGINGKNFKAYKFRTMIPNSDNVYGIISAEENDHRITKVGRILRNMGLDELPQILNIFMGQMSFVGPRPLAVGEILHERNGQVVGYEEFPGFWERLSVLPGLTGLATIYIPKDSPPKKKFRYDLLYIRKISLCLDLKLIVLSFWISFRGKWEARKEKL